MRKTNFTQIIHIDFQVTDTERAVTNAGFADRFAHEEEKAAKEWRNDAEFALMRSTLVSGTGSAARSMAGVKAQISTNKTNVSLVSLSETMFNDYLSLSWDNGGEIDEVYVGKQLKRRISGFSGNGNVKNIAADDKRLVNAVDIYDSDFGGVVKLFKHRFVQLATDTNYDLVGLDSQYWKVAWLRHPETTELAKTGSATKGQIEGELTLEARSEAASVLVQALL